MIAGVGISMGGIGEFTSSSSLPCLDYDAILSGEIVLTGIISKTGARVAAALIVQTTVLVSRRTCKAGATGGITGPRAPSIRGTSTISRLRARRG